MSGADATRQKRQPEPSAPSLAAVFALALGVCFFVADLVLMLLNAGVSELHAVLIIQTVENLAFLVGVGIGYLILRAQPKNRVGWCLIVACCSLLLTSLASQLALLGFREWGAVGPTLFALWVARWAWIGSQAAGPFLFLYYPSGQLPSKQWKPVLWYFWLVVGFAVFTYASSADATPPTWAPQPAFTAGSPVVGGWLVGEFGRSLDSASQVLLMSLNVLGGLSLVFRYRRSSNIERSQIKVIALVAILSLVGLISLRPLRVDPSIAALLNIGIVTLAAVSIGLAITRYRLFDIDRLISRTISYALVLGALGGIYLAMVAAAAGMLPSRDSFVVAAATLMVAAAFNPLRRRVQVWVDMRFNRSHYDAQKVLDEFSTRIASETETEVVAGEFVAAVVQAVEPAAVGVWVARDSGSRAHSA